MVFRTILRFLACAAVIIIVSSANWKSWVSARGTETSSGRIRSKRYCRPSVARMKSEGERGSP